MLEKTSSDEAIHIAADKKKTAVLFLGMHRSGTSATAGVFSRLGVNLGSDLLPPQDDNPKGFYESREVMRLHDEILAALDSTWDDPRPLPDGWERDPRIARFKVELRNFIRREFWDSALLGVKDPRLCRLLPVWLPLLEEIGAEPKVIFVLRDPADTYFSLHKRNEMGAEQAAMLWLAHIVAAERSSRHLSRAPLSYEGLLHDWRGEIVRVGQRLSLELSCFSSSVSGSIERFLSQQLHHEHGRRPPPLHSPQNAMMGELHKELCAWRDGEDLRLDRFDTAARELAAAESMSRPVAAYLLTQKDLVTLRKDAVIADVRQQVELLTAEAENARAQSLSLTIERDAARQEAAAYQAETAAARAETKIVRAQVDAARGEVSALQADLDRLSQELTEAYATTKAAHTEAEANDASAAARLNVLTRDLDDSLETIARLEAQVRDIFASSSWKVTAPIRNLVTHLPRVARRRSGSSSPGQRRRERARTPQPESDGSPVLSPPPEAGAFAPSAAEVQLSEDAKAIANSSYFDAAWYLQHHPHVAKLTVDPAVHYLTRGAAEGCDPGPDFQTRWYLEQNADVAQSGLNPLLHYIRYGDLEGRPPTSKLSRFQVWARRYDTLSDSDRSAIRAHIGRLERKPLISVVMPIYETSERLLREAIESVQRQLYPNWELCVADDASTAPHVRQVLTHYASSDPRIKVSFRATNGHIVAATNSALSLAVGEFIALMDHDDLLPEHALYEVVVEINAHPDVNLIYSDEDKIDAEGARLDGYFKSDWNPELFLTQNMISHLGVYRKSLVDRLGGLRLGFEGSQDYDLALRVVAASRPDQIRHIPAVLYHWRRDTGTFSETWLDRCTAAARQAIAEHLKAKAPPVMGAEVVPAPRVPEHNRVVYPVPEPRPMVSIIIPTRNRSELLARCVEGCLQRTDYEPIEIIIVDHESDEPSAIRLLNELRQDHRVTVCPFQGEFNYSKMNNVAVRQAKGDVVLLMNNDVEVIGGDWLREMVSHAIRPEVGAVGAKLLYPDRTVQHAGLALGAAGVALSYHLGAPSDSVGYFGHLSLQRNVSAVTAACMALRRDVFVEVGGFDQVNLPVAFNDVDLCLRIREKGYQIVWTPYAELYHREGASRGTDDQPKRSERFESEIEYMHQRWAIELVAEPFYNPNFSLSRADFILSFPPRRKKPWQAN